MTDFNNLKMTTLVSTSTWRTGTGAEVTVHSAEWAEQLIESGQWVEKGSNRPEVRNAETSTT